MSQINDALKGCLFDRSCTFMTLRTRNKQTPGFTVPVLKVATAFQTERKGTDKCGTLLGEKSLLKVIICYIAWCNHEQVHLFHSKSKREHRALFLVKI